MTHPGGRPPIFSSPDEMMLMFEEYKQWADANPVIKTEAIKSGENAGDLIKIPLQRPYTIWGFARYCKCSRQAIQNYGSNDIHKEFFGVYEAISTEMTEQNVAGGLNGTYNASLTARINGIVDKTETEHTGLKEVPNELKVKLVSSK
jgi:hypothetical protein